MLAGLRFGGFANHSVSRFRKGGDEKIAILLEPVIYPEEVTHCAAGVKWFSYLCLKETIKAPMKANISIKDITLAKVKEKDDILKPKSEIRRLGFDDGDSSSVRELSPTSFPRDGESILEVAAFHSVVRKYFRGPLKPPFNDVACVVARFGPEWYLPLASKT